MAKKAKGTGFWADFKKFISRGNVVDMAVGVVIGGAFGKIVTGFVNYIINPFIGIFVKDGGLDGIKTVITAADEAAGIEEVAILWGTWIQTIIDFLIVALCIFLMVRIINKITEAAHAKENAEKAAAEKAAAEKAEADKKLADEAAAAKAAEDAAFRASVLAQEKLLAEIRDSLKKN